MNSFEVPIFILPKNYPYQTSLPQSSAKQSLPQQCKPPKYQLFVNHIPLVNEGGFLCCLPNKDKLTHSRDSVKILNKHQPRGKDNSISNINPLTKLIQQHQTRFSKRQPFSTFGVLQEAEQNQDQTSKRVNPFLPKGKERL